MSEMTSIGPYRGLMPSGSYTESRIGTVTAATPNSMFVDVGGTVIEVAFIVPFTNAAVLPPARGTIVQLVRQDASWVAIGRLVGAGSNAVVNPSFEASPAGGQPAGWVSYDVSGASVATVVDIADAPEGDLAVRVFSGQSSVHYLYSAPIPVNAGEVWSLSAFAGGDYAGGPETADAAIVALWFANSTNLYPTTSAADTVATVDLDIPQYPPFRSLYQSVTVPAATFYMRVALRSTLAAGQALVWDQVIARRV
jgi:hypothetical protein